MKGGWYHTSDMGYMDEDGYIFMTDRKADMIISGGENVYPAEVENVIYQHPAVRECTVVSAPDAKWGEIVQAVVVLNPGTKGDGRGDHRALQEDPGRIQVPQGGGLLGCDIPKTIIGKIVKKEIKKKFWEGKERMIS